MTIVVTGLGAVTALGSSASETFESIILGKRGFRELTLFDPGEVRSRVVADVVDVVEEPGDKASRTSSLALRAAKEAIVHAGLDVRRRRTGLVLGGTTAGMFETESTLASLLSVDRDEALSKMLKHPLSAPTDHLASELGPFARTRSVSSACSSGANALAIGAVWLELGLVDAVVCGAADALCRVTVSGFSALGALDPDGARPFDVRRRGLTLGEGAGMVVLERADDAGARHRAVCTLLGWASRSEAHHITNPEATGEAPVAAMRAAVARAGLSPKDIDYVNAHGTGTLLNDAMETRALGRFFETELGSVRVSSQKGMIGHTLAASGAIEAVITALAIARGIVPPTGGLEDPDPACGLRHVLTAERHLIRTAISNSFGFGGMDTTLVFGSGVHDAPPRPEPRAVFVTGLAALTPGGIVSGKAAGDLPRDDSASSVVIADDALDPVIARRLDRTSRLGAIACERALGGAPSDPSRATRESHRGVGLVLGNAFGAVDATAEYMRRLRDKGARLVRPADFPSLVPSSPAGHISIYLGLTGPAFVVADLGVSGECALAQAFELVAAGDVERMCAGAIEERSAIVEAVFSVAFGGRDSVAQGPRLEGGAALCLASSSAIADAGITALARIENVVSFADGPGAPSVVLDDIVAAPPKGALVVLGNPSSRVRELVAASRWGRCPIVGCGPATGTHEAAGSVAMAVAAARVARGDAPAALFVGNAGGSGYAGTVWSVERSR